MEAGNIIHGFEVVRVRDITDVDGTLYELVHTKTGAELCYLKRDDSNKTFCITFKTLPSDDTGVFHILEHTVLNGSKKYPVKEPFVELLKGSMQTFLNAFTAPDKTMYPVASKNDKDFMNLMSVYMDAVFNPRIYTTPNIFYQEGWHYEIENAEDTPQYNGVVLNEMKGAFSSVDETLVAKLNQVLFPDNCYRFESGGDPNYITDLTYEKFIETHKIFYHPSNARVFLDGDIKNIDEVLAFIDDEYFSKYEKEDKSFEIQRQEIKPAQKVSYEYELAADEELKDHTQIAFAKIVADYDDVEKNIAWSLLASILVANNESKLKKAILDKNLAEDVELDIMDASLQPWVILNLRNTNEDSYDEAKKVLQDTTREIMSEGLDASLIKAALNQMEFRYKEKKELAGLSNIQLAMRSWLYGGDPSLYISRGSIYETLRKKADEGYFEKLLEEFLLDDEHLNSVIAIPSHTAAQKRLETEQEKLKQAKASWDDVQEYVDFNKEFTAWQKEVDTQEALDTIPKLQLSDIDEKPEDYPWEYIRHKGVDVLTYPSDKSGIVYINMYFSLAGLTIEDLPKVALYADLLTNLPTEKHTTEELQKEIRANCGIMTFAMETFTTINDAHATKPMLVCHLSALKQNVDTAIDLAREVMQETIFTKDNVYPHIGQTYEEFRQSLISSGHVMAVNRVLAGHSADSMFREYTSGYESGQYIKKFNEHYDDTIEDFLEETELVKEIIFAKDRATISLNEDINILNSFIDQLHTTEAQKAKVHYPFLKEKKEKISIPGGVSYVSQGGNLQEFGGAYEARMAILAHAISYDYLWSAVRVEGGAYGCGLLMELSGSYATYSYRDPNPLHTIEANKNIYKYLEDLTEATDITQLIIGTIAGLEPLTTPANKIRTADSRYFREIDYALRVENRKEILETTLNDLKEYASLLKEAFENSSICVIGNSEALEELDEDFKEA